MKSWTVGQKVVCDRQNRQFSGCIVRSINADSIVIFCPALNTVICGQRKNLERLGWRSDPPQADLIVACRLEVADCEHLDR